MVEALLEKPIDLFREGDIDGALADLEEKLQSNAEVAELHHMWAEFANMKNMEAQDDVIAGRKIMNAYKKAMELDEDNMEYIADYHWYYCIYQEDTSNKIWHLQYSYIGLVDIVHVHSIHFLKSYLMVCFYNKSYQFVQHTFQEHSFCILMHLL